MKRKVMGMIMFFCLLLGTVVCKQEKAPPSEPSSGPEVAAPESSLKSESSAPESTSPPAEQPFAYPPPGSPPSSPPSPSASASPGGTASSPTAVTPKIPPELYWKIQLERLKLTKEVYSESLVIYEKYKGNTPEAQAEIRELQKKKQEKMRELFTAHNVNPRDFYPQGSEAREITQMYQQYRKEHPEIDSEYEALMTEIRSLRDKKFDIVGRERPMMRGPGREESGLGPGGGPPRPPEERGVERPVTPPSPSAGTTPESAPSETPLPPSSPPQEAPTPSPTETPPSPPSSPPGGTAEQ